jgi:phage terminase small subunit
VPILKNPRWEKFASGLVAGLTQSAAYKGAYGQKTNYSVNVRSEASKLFKQPEVRLRIVELQNEVAKAAGITAQDLVKETDAIYKLAMRTRQPGAAVAAIGLKGKLLGLVIDRAEIETTQRKPARRATTDKNMSLADWKDKFQPKLDGETLQ